MAEKGCNSPPKSKQHEQDKNQDDAAKGPNGGSPPPKTSREDSTSSTQGLTSPSSGGFSSKSSVSSKRETSNPVAGSTDDSRNALGSDRPLREKPSGQYCQRFDCSASDCNQDATVAGSSTASESLPRKPVSTGQTSREFSPSDLLATYDLFRDNCLRLYRAALNGDVNEAIDLARAYPSVLGKAITKRCQTVFHVATGAKQLKFVEEMVNLLLGSYEDPLERQRILELQDKKGNNAFCYAAAAGTVEIAKILLREDKNLLEIRGSEELTPLNIAALYGQRDMVSYLKKEIDKLKKAEEGDIREKQDRQNTFFISIHNGWYDVALNLLSDDKSLAVARDEDDMTALHLLAKIPLAFASESAESIVGTLKNLVISIIPAGMNCTTHKSKSSTQALDLLEEVWEEILRREYLTVEDFIKTPTNLLFDAASLGNSKFLAELIRNYPCLVYERDQDGRSIFHVAIMHRHIATFNLIYNLGLDKQLIAIWQDEDDNNLLHLAATYLSAEKGKAASMVQGAALEMQQELIIFKVVELLVMPKYKELKNLAGDTPRQLFTKEHAKLLESGKKWMKETAKSCSLVATLIATGVFTAAFSLPGGHVNTDETSMDITKTAFHIFVMADAVALVSSSISILLFLSILTSRYAENDFLRSLPLKLVSGIATLFISIVAMMIAFSSTFFLTYGQHKFKRFPIAITVLVSLSVPVFVLSQFRLFVDILYSSFRFRFSIKPGSSTSLWTKKGQRRFACSFSRPFIGWRPPRNPA